MVPKIYRDLSTLENLPSVQKLKEQVLPSFTQSRLDQRKSQIERKPSIEKNVMRQRLMSIIRVQVSEFHQTSRD